MKLNENSKKVIGCFLKQDLMERNLGYRISGNGQPDRNVIDPINMNNMQSYNRLYGDQWNNYGNVPNQTPSNIPLNNTRRRNDVSDLLPADYKVAIARDNTNRQEIAKSLERNLPIQGSGRRIVSSNEVNQMRNARKNPDGIIYNSQSQEIIKSLKRQNDLLMDQLETMKEMIEENRDNKTRRR